MAISCNVQDLNAAARCQQCISLGLKPIVDVAQQAWLAGVGDNPQTFLANSAAFETFFGTPGINLAAQVYLLALIRGGSSDPKILTDLAKVFTLTEGGMLPDIISYLWAVNAGNSTDTNKMIAESTRYMMLLGMAARVQTYLMCQIALRAGVITSCNPQNLITQSRCFFNCLSPAELLGIKAFLLCQTAQVAGGSGAGAGLPGGMPMPTNPHLPGAGLGWVPGIPGGFSYVMLADNQTNQITWTVDPAAPSNAVVEVWTTTDPSGIFGIAIESTPTMFTAQPFVLNALGSAGQKFCRIRFRTADSLRVGLFTPILSITTIRQNLVAYWKMEEATGATRMDATANAHNLTDKQSSIQQTAGKVNFAALGVLAPGNSKLMLATHADFVMGANASFSIAFWFNPQNALTDNAPMFAKWGAALANDEYICLYLVADGGHEFQAVNLALGQKKVLFNPAPTTIGTWYFLACGYDDANQVVWTSVNAGAKQTTACVGVNAGTSDLAITNYSDQAATDSANNSKIDEFGFWRRVLSASDLTYLFNSGNGKTFPL